MSDDSPDEEFWEIADSFIHLANQHLERAGRGKVSAAFLYAVARFNAFLVAAEADSPEEMANDKSPALAYFTQQYKKILRENLDDNIKNFERYKE